MERKEKENNNINCEVTTKLNLINTITENQLFTYLLV